MKYNNKLKPLVLPEYGRNVQQMIDHCMSIEDRAERQTCAEFIIRTMQNVSPDHMRRGEGDGVYWDHLAFMSGFSLDIDFPEGTISEEKIKSKVGKLPYQSHNIKYRYYGHIVEDLISKILDMPEGDERRSAEYQVALHMKRLYLSWNKDSVDDLKIFKDLYELSKGQIMLTPENCRLNINSVDHKSQQSSRNKKMINNRKNKS